MLSLIEEEKRNILISSENKMLENQEHIEEFISENIEPYKTDRVYVPKNKTLAELSKIWKEV